MQEERLKKRGLHRLDCCRKERNKERERKKWKQNTRIGSLLLLQLFPLMNSLWGGGGGRVLIRTSRHPSITLALMWWWLGGAWRRKLILEPEVDTRLRWTAIKVDPRGSTLGTWCLANRKSLELMTDWIFPPPSPELNIILFAASLANDTKPEETIFKRLESGITDSTHTARDGLDVWL